MDIPRLFRSYRSYTAGEYENATIWQAGRATSAAPTFFKRLRIGTGALSEEFLDGGLGSNNPTKILLNEVGEVFDKTRSISCIISIGTGKADVIEAKAPGFFQKVIPTDLIEALKCMSTDCENIAREMESRFSTSPNLCFRFNVDQGLQDVGMEEWKELGNIKAKTIQYLEEPSIKEKVDQAALALSNNVRKCSVRDIGIESNLRCFLMVTKSRFQVPVSIRVALLTLPQATPMSRSNTHLHKIA
jgi:hypothetical protein